MATLVSEMGDWLLATRRLLTRNLSPALSSSLDFPESFDRSGRLVEANPAYEYGSSIVGGESNSSGGGGA